MSYRLLKGSHVLLTLMNAMKTTFYPVVLLFVSSFVYAQVKVETNKDVDMRTFKTFRIDNGELVSVTQQPVNEKELRETVRSAIIEELKSKGYRHVDDSASAMCSITFVAEVIEKLEQQNVGPLGQRPASTAADMDQSTIWSRETRQGSLVIEVVENARKKFLWRANSTVEFGTYALNDVMRGTVARALRKYPRIKK